MVSPPQLSWGVNQDHVGTCNWKRLVGDCTTSPVHLSAHKFENNAGITSRFDSHAIDGPITSAAPLNLKSTVFPDVQHPDSPPTATPFPPPARSPLAVVVYLGAISVTAVMCAGVTGLVLAGVTYAVTVGEEELPRLDCGTR